MIPVRPIPPTVARNPSGSPPGVSVRDLARSPSISSISSIQPAEAAVAALVLAVHVGGDRAADGEVAGAGQHRQQQAFRDHRASRSAKVVDAEARTVAAAASRSMRGGGHRVQHHPARVLRRVPVAAPRAAGQHAARRPARHQLPELLAGQRPDHPGARRRGAAPAGQQPPGLPLSDGGHYSPPANSASQPSSQQTISRSRAIRSSTGLAGW